MDTKGSDLPRRGESCTHQSDTAGVRRTRTWPQVGPHPVRVHALTSPQRDRPNPLQRDPGRHPHPFRTHSSRPDVEGRFDHLNRRSGPFDSVEDCKVSVPPRLSLSSGRPRTLPTGTETEDGPLFPRPRVPTGGPRGDRLVEERRQVETRTVVVYF